MSQAGVDRSIRQGSWDEYSPMAAQSVELFKLPVFRCNSSVDLMLTYAHLWPHDRCNAPRTGTPPDAVLLVLAAVSCQHGMQATDAADKNARTSGTAPGCVPDTPFPTHACSFSWNRVCCVAGA